MNYCMTYFRDNASVVCSGRGECLCGMCKCYSDNDVIIISYQNDVFTLISFIST